MGGAATVTKVIFAGGTSAQELTLGGSSAPVVEYIRGSDYGREVEMAWDLSCRDRGSVLQILKRIEVRCQKGKEWKRKHENTANGCQEPRNNPDETKETRGLS